MLLKQTTEIACNNEDTKHMHSTGTTKCNMIVMESYDLFLDVWSCMSVYAWWQITEWKE